MFRVARVRREPVAVVERLEQDVGLALRSSRADVLADLERAQRRDLRPK